jgi:hypothetical protein
MSESSVLAVTSHVGRDLLQSAAVFKHEHAVVWEYVSNGLQYVDGVAPIVTVSIDQSRKRIIIKDNGRGMSFSDLHRYFQMHGENLDRKQGKPGRGMFGTGKSAAFGIADGLVVATVQNARRSKVELHRSAINSPGAASRVPVTVLENEIPTTEPNGTTVEISGIQLRRIDGAAIKREIERHIAHWPKATVYVDHNLCEYVEPASSREEHISTAGTPFESMLPAVELHLKVAKAPLDEAFQGVAIISGSALHELTLAGCERKPFANYIFGSIDVPQLATDTSPIPAFDMTRSMQLNRNNELVRQVLAFIGANVERVLRELEHEDQQRKRDETARKLQKEADAIASLINRDFQDWSKQIRKVVAATTGGMDQTPGPTQTGSDELLTGEGDILAVLEDQEGGVWIDHGNQPGPGPGPEPRPGPQFKEDPSGSEHVGKKPADESTRRRSGGFKVDFREMGNEEARAKYEREHRIIYINLDHPQIAAAKGMAGIEDPTFRRLAYEVAFSEYAIALASELAAKNWYMDPAYPITDIRDTLNRLARAAASLYA